MYKNIFPKLFNKITQGTANKKINLFDACADTEMNQNIHDINPSVESINHNDNTFIPIKYRQQKNESCGFYSLASVLHHIQDE